MMGMNGGEARIKPIREADSENERGHVLDGVKYDESEPLLMVQKVNGEVPNGHLQPKARRKVQWNDIVGNKLTEVFEFQPSDGSDNEDEVSDACFCTIM